MPKPRLSSLAGGLDQRNSIPAWIATNGTEERHGAAAGPQQDGDARGAQPVSGGRERTDHEQRDRQHRIFGRMGELAAPMVASDREGEEGLRGHQETRALKQIFADKAHRALRLKPDRHHGREIGDRAG